MEENLKLANAVMAWWKNHEFDVYQTEDDEYNVFDDEPEFVTIARKIIEAAQQGRAVDAPQAGT